jgi:hypothetical protein
MGLIYVNYAVQLTSSLRFDGRPDFIECFCLASGIHVVAVLILAIILYAGGPE